MYYNELNWYINCDLQMQEMKRECMWGCFGNSGGVWVKCVLVFTVFCIILYCAFEFFRLCIFILIYSVCTIVKTTATE
jgi:hypothetical protein